MPWVSWVELQVLRARLAFVYDPKAPVSLIARACRSSAGRGASRQPTWPGSSRIRPRRSARRPCSPSTPNVSSPEVRQAVIDRLADKAPEVRRTAIEVLARLNMREAIPRLLAAANEDTFRNEATLALAAMPDPQALPIYLTAIQDRNPELRRAGNPPSWRSATRSRATSPSNSNPASSMVPRR